MKLFSQSLHNAVLIYQTVKFRVPARSMNSNTRTIFTQVFCTNGDVNVSSSEMFSRLLLSEAGIMETKQPVLCKLGS
jgi:hypothetical protein